MMGKEPLGNFSSNLDDLFKKIINGSNPEGIFSLIHDSVIAMKRSMNEPHFDFGKMNLYSSTFIIVG